MSKDTVIYVIGRMEGPVKVGITSNLKARFKQIKTGCPFPIEPLYAVRMRSREHALWHENNFHIVYGESRMEGEWFDLEAELAVEGIDCALETEAVFEERERNGEFA